MKSQIGTLRFAAGIALLIAAISSGCQSGMEPCNGTNPVSFTAAIEQGDAATKTVLGGTPGEERPVQWSSDDKMIVGGAVYSVATLSSDGRSATLSGTGAKADAQGFYEAFYPKEIYNNGTLELPSTQYYTPGRIDNLPMYARSTTTNLTFKNLCSVLSISLKGYRSVAHIYVWSETTDINGTFSVTWEGGNPVLTLDSGYYETDLDCLENTGGEGVLLDPDVATFFYVAIPAQEYALGDLGIEVEYTDGMTQTYQNTRAFTGLPSTYYEVNKEKYFGVSFDGASGTSRFGGNTLRTDFSPKKLPFTVTTNMPFEVTVTGPDGASHTVGASTQDDTPVVVALSLNDLVGGVPDPGMTTAGQFTVSTSGTKVTFSSGNLQYRASTGRWRFAERQWDYVGGTASQIRYGTVYEGGVKSDNALIAQDYDGWIDLFGWGTSGYGSWPSGSYGAATMPWSANYNTTYGPQSDSYDLTGDYANGDWGIANAGVLGNCRTLSAAEWTHLLTGRQGWLYMRAKIWFGSEKRKFTVTFATTDPDCPRSETFTIEQTVVPDISGLVVFPDGFQRTDLIDESLVFRKTSSGGDVIEGSSGINYNQVRNWLVLQAAGCVFLPAAAYRAETGVFYPGRTGDYWSSSSAPNMSEPCAKMLHFSDYGRPGVEDFHTEYPALRYFGYSVRLVKDVE